MATDRKKHNRNYYAEHSDIWKRNYEKNIEARRENARVYASNKWESDPVYRAAHTRSSIARSRTKRRVASLVHAAEKILHIFQKISENTCLFQNK